MDDVRQFLGLLTREVRKAQEAGDLDLEAAHDALERVAVLADLHRHPCQRPAELRAAVGVRAALRHLEAPGRAGVVVLEVDRA
jgi:hypothetical protein